MPQGRPTTLPKSSKSFYFGVWSRALNCSVKLIHHSLRIGGHGCAQFKSSSSLSHFPSVYHWFRHNYNNPPKHSNHSLTCITLYTIAFRGHGCAQFESSSSLSHFLSYIMGFHITIMIHQNIQTTHSHAYTIAAGGHGCAQFTSSSSLSHFPFVYHGF